MTSSPSETATRVLKIEAKALELFANSIPDDFESAIAAILQMKGRMIVSGMGKSGHVGRKIAATLASTGTPAYFVHPGEASHGDLGMITSDDICLLLSNSGETAELSDILAYSNRFGIPVIGFSGRPDSTLMQASQFKITLPPAKEACSIGMAPTTSTTMAMAMGDALAVALMEARGFRPENFRNFHPGGKLGAQMRRVSELMHGPESIALVGEDTLMTEVLVTMSEKGFGIAAVTGGDSKLLGIITDGDLRRNMSTLLSSNAGAVASTDPATVSPTMLAANALALMNERKISVLIAVNDANEPVGILHVHDCLRAGIV
tara:strand:- start:339 stop:1295 length:957 start_codon:yes stop_codon:yes gene_type:complete